MLLSSQIKVGKILLSTPNIFIDISNISTFSAISIGVPPVYKF
jgi:hypothetical protein